MEMVTVEVRNVEVLVGLPASGKSTYAKEHPEYVHLSSDAIREEHDYKIDNNKVFKLMETRMFEALAAGHDVIYDATNLSAKRRKHLVSMIKNFERSYDEKTATKMSIVINCRVFFQPLEVLYDRNSKRTGRACVPEDVIDRMLKQFQMPMKWEGFNTIIIDKSSKGEPLPFEDICTLKQDNPYHSYTLGEHLAMASNYALSCEYTYAEVGAALYHDVGKILTKEYDEYGIAHFYGHENVGAYMLALHFLDKAWLKFNHYIEMIELVNYHMRPYVWKQSKKAYDRDMKWFGPNFIDKLKEVHACDRHAH